MYCPQCRAEYRDGFTECSDCHIPLSEGSPPSELSSHYDPGLDLVVVAGTNDFIQLAMAKGLLEDAGIPFFVGGHMDAEPALYKAVEIQVPRNREAEARDLLAPLLQPEDGPPGA